ncbi:Cell fate regulator YaaT, PSP1 superfamily (controls sporulation, competence, biofilm development) [Lachnospiraceae bacterium]|nr:Cell fate regulator YaaT, PSP1 superfamily (controls sporulation, competence, biofilm development) [Lachnospiraceae bacterium]
MVKVISVRFQTAGKVYYFAPGEYDIKKGDHVIVETARGVEFGRVVSDIMEVEEKNIVSPLKAVMRIATEEDEKNVVKNRARARDAFKICKEKIRKHNLEMKLIDAEYTFDNNKLLFYFTADGRVDFRELVKDLASVFRTRIELRQIGVRDETKILGGYGPCGRVLCCHCYLGDFSPVSIKMAKEQNLSLNPTKISGVCGRLMCCLKNEEETYEYLNKNLPGLGDIVATPEGEEGSVASINVLRQLIKVLFDNGDEKEIREYPAADLTFRAKKPKKNNNQPKKKTAEEREEEAQTEELEKLEQEFYEKLNEERQGGRNRQQDRNRGDRNNQNNRNDHSQDKNRDNRNGGRGENRNNFKNRENQNQNRRDPRGNRNGQNRNNRGNQNERDNRNNNRDRRDRGRRDDNNGRNNEE